MDNQDKVKDWSNKRAQEMVKSTITEMFESILDFTEVSLADDDRYKVVRSKILRVGNDAIRRINSELGRNYEVVFTGIRQDLVRIKNGRDK